MLALLPPLVFALAGPVEEITRGVQTVASPGIPGGVAALDRRAFAIVEGKGDLGWRPVAAASTLGRGRVVAFGHDGYFGTGALAIGDTKRLLNNVVEWAAVRKNPRIGYFAAGPEAVLKQLNGTVWLKSAGDLANVDVVVMDAGAPITGVQKFVENGGGLVVANTGWGWLQMNPGKSLSLDMPINRVLQAAGLSITDAMLGSARPASPSLEPASYRVDDVLKAIGEGKGEGEDIVTSALRSLPLEHPLVRRASALASDADRVIPTAKAPIGADQARLRLAINLRRQLMGPAQEGPAVPAAADFPGAVEASAKRETVTLDKLPTNGQWASTGAYAAAGETIAVTVPAELASAGLQFQIGCHSDTLWHLSKWQRMPDLISQKPITSVKTTLRSPYGGLVYIVVPQKLSARGSVRIENVVRAGWFVKGRTTAAKWRADLEAGAPWAELQGENLILSVPTSEAKKIADPEALMKLWDRTLVMYSELDGNPLFDRPERMVADRQISAGYMHSGYPIMTWMDDSVPLSLDVTRLTTQGTWGHWHELGHNRQKSDWTFEGTGEVTNNVFTLYMMQMVAGKGIWERLNQEVRAGEKTYLAAPNYEKWKSDPFLALTMYGRLIDAFGWDSMKAYFRSYPSHPREWSDQMKRDQFLIHYSRVVKRNLGPFFVAWGIPVSSEARNEVAGLPAWDWRPSTP